MASISSFGAKLKPASSQMVETPSCSYCLIGAIIVSGEPTRPLRCWAIGSSVKLNRNERKTIPKQPHQSRMEVYQEHDSEGKARRPTAPSGDTRGSQRPWDDQRRNEGRFLFLDFSLIGHLPHRFVYFVRISKIVMRDRFQITIKLINKRYACRNV